MKVRVGSRASRLAVIQAEIVINSIRTACPGVETELITFTTTGDKILDKTLDKVGGKGLFVKELDAALYNGKVDVCVHSYKDVPMQVPPEIPIVAVSARTAPHDVLVLPEGSLGLDVQKPVGCSSARRQLQLRSLFPDMSVVPVRGNVVSRLEKLDRGEFGALVLAEAGLVRLGCGHRISRVFTPQEMLPAACQGILAVQCRKEFDVLPYLRLFADRDAWDISLAERAFVRALDGGCSAPTAAYATLEDNVITLEGLYVADHGQVLRRRVTGPRHQAESLGTHLADVMRFDANKPL